MKIKHGSKAINWRTLDVSAKFLELFYKIAEDEIKTKEGFYTALKEINWHEKELVWGVEPKIIRFFEFSFAISGSLYSPLYPLTKKVVKKLFEWCPGLKNLINETAADAIGNIVLEARGRIAFTVSNKKDLEQIIADWKEMGIEKLSMEEVFVSLLNKPTIRQKILKRNIKIRYLLNTFFSDYCKVFPLLLLREEEKEEYEKFLRDDQKISPDSLGAKELEKLIAEENTKSKFYIGRNYKLSWLIKKKHDFKCQICNALRTNDIAEPAVDLEQDKKQIEVHHLVPLEEGGEDCSSNIIVICSEHHKMFHNKELSFKIDGDKIIVEFLDGQKVTIEKN